MSYTHVLWGSGYKFSNKYSGVPDNVVIKEFEKKGQLLSLQDVCIELNNDNLASDLCWFIPVDVINNKVGIE